MIPIPNTQLIRKGVKKLLGTPLFSPVRSMYSGFGSILMYHRVVGGERRKTLWNDPTAFQPNLGISVHRDSFEEQMAYISDHYRCVSLDTFHDVLVGMESAPQKGEKPLIAVTFDDGYLDNLEEALPLLEKYDIPATIFVTPGLTDQSTQPWWYLLEGFINKLPEITVRIMDGERTFSCKSTQQKKTVMRILDGMFRRRSCDEQQELMAELYEQYSGEDFSLPEFLNWSQVAQLAEHPLITIGAHTMTHPVLRREGEEDVISQIQESRTVLEQKLKQPVRYLAYPFGDRAAVGRRSFRITEELGFSLAVTTRTGHVHASHIDDLCALPRITVDYFDTLESFQSKLAGVEAFVRSPFEPMVSD